MIQSSKDIDVAVFGATGYSGFELVKLLLNHPRVRLGHATSGSNPDANLNQLHPTTLDLPLCSPQSVPLNEIDLAFLCLPHGAGPGRGQEEAARLARAGVRVIDLGGDYRLREIDHYRRWYQTEHAHADLLGSFVYGLSEFHRTRIADATRVANPGCYPTCTALALYPLAEAGWLTEGSIVINAVSGLSGAGRGLKIPSLFVEANENVTPYHPGQVHRHVPEIMQTLRDMSGAEIPSVVFVPHLAPVNRGILATIHVPLSQGPSMSEIREHYAARYEKEPFVHLLAEGATASLKHTCGTNHTAISLHPCEGGLVVVASIDNLLKGAAGQAVQNMNLMFGLPETEGLPC
ncbi:N-acetyl-gamma-glutamyl-phosphate reductase [Sulfidibacter corallicola]|uniref:N-acetyl-gamma-glutamyl-phosphate reductase n=1 Tax=Sulfidibacter corallicola TaxID=2818388 RepID=A0A8A4TXF6_SULCO|nr:N-acetyl-gamma-glutamyl-phosphate reductase [Sulfidibacter corallicola]QTD53794.1 N-acetyl-gamma-glutamyl-phosphate reductase [Sulfidibacter corallicola]